MKNVLFLTLLTFLALTLGVIAAFAADCFLFEGTYTGAALLNGKESRPLFFVVANKHIAGFFAPEDQTHPGGLSIDQSELTNDIFILSLTADDKILVKYATSNSLDGKAKLIEVMGGSGTYHGYYTNPDSGRDFLNIGEDGGAVLRVTAGRDFVFAFGKINSNGKFVQVFPESDKGPQIDITISGAAASVSISTTGGLSNGRFNSEMQRTEVTNCTGSSMSESSSSGGDVSSGESSSGGNPPNESIFVTNYKNTLGELEDVRVELKKLEDDKNITDDGHTFIKKNDKRIERVINNLESIFDLPDRICQAHLIITLKELKRIVRTTQALLCSSLTDPDCKLPETHSDPSRALLVIKFQSVLNKIKEITNTNDNGNKISDICEE